MSVKKISGEALTQLFLNKHSTLTDAMRVINSAECKIALVVSTNRKLLGVVTDGDIRRGIINGLGLNSSVSKVMTTKFHSIFEKSTFSQAAKVMNQSEILVLPELQPNSAVVKSVFYFGNEPPTPKVQNVAVIMAGGLGERMLHHTKNTPKPLLKVGNSTLLDIALDQCSKAGITKFYISVNYLKHQIIEHLGDGSERGFEIKYLEEDERLGTAGALSLIEDNLANPFILINADVLHKVDLNDFLRFHISAESMITVGVRQYENRIPFGVIKVENGRISDLVEKPVETHLVNAGIYSLDPDVLSYLKERKYIDMPDLIRKIMVDNGKVIPYLIHEYWLDVGNPESLDIANLEWS